MPNANVGRDTERRVAPRLPVCWSGLVLVGPQTQRCMVRDLSPTGANLGHVGTLKRSQIVSLQIRHGRGELTLAARVAWIDDLHHQAGVAFLGASRDAADRLRDALLAALRRLRSGAGRLLVVGLVGDDAKDVMQAARACGLEVECVSTPLDAIRKLQGHDAPTAVVVAPNLTGTEGRAFLDLVERERPSVARILVADGRPPPGRGIEAGPRLIYRPWDALDLSAAIDAAVHFH